MQVAVLDDYQDVARTLGPWERLGPDVELTVFTDHVAGQAELAERLRPFDVVVAMRERAPFTRPLFESLPNLRLLVTTGMANAAIDMPAAAANGITVCGTSAPRGSTTELTWALILAVTRHVVAEDGAIRAGGWQHTLGTELAGRTLGLAGLGRIGREMVPVARAFGMRVLAWSPNLTQERAAAEGVEAVAKERLFSESDVVSIHLVLSDRTRGLIGRDDLERMQPTAYLVNTSRGPILDEAALLEALHAGTIAGAGLDVFDVEPLPVDHPLRSAPNTVLTPHVGYVTRGTYELWWREIVEDVEAFRAGAPVRVIAP